MHLIPHSFNKYLLTEEETKSGHILTESNKGIIQNLISDAAQAKLNLTLDPQNINAYVQEESFLKGQIAILNYLLDMHETILADSYTNQNQLGE